jgi:hypothetical protein
MLVSAGAVIFETRPAVYEYRADYSTLFTDEKPNSLRGKSAVDQRVLAVAQKS